MPRFSERKPELWTYPAFARATAYSARHEDANSYYDVPGLQSLYGRSYAFQAGTGRLTQLSRPWVGDTVWARTLAYTARGQLQSVSDNLLAAPTCTATGGTLLDGIVCTGASTPYKALAFQYDSAGNLTKQLDQLGGSDSLSATYAAGNRLQTIGGATYTYDADGNVATRTAGGITTSFTYDHQSQLISVRVGTDTTFYGYNAAGRLVTRARNNNSGTTKRTLERVSFWDADHLLVETDSTLVTPVAEYAYAPGVDRPLALLTPGAGGSTKIRYYHQDEVGNVIGLTDSTAVVQALEYRPWGELAPSTLGTVGDTSRVRWKGLLWEEGKTQLYYVRNRWYDAGARRFLTEDPIGIDGGLNLYAFAGNDPLNYSDPSGLCAEGESVEIVIYPDQWTKKCVARGGGIFFRGFFGGGQAGVSWGAFNAGLGFVPGVGDLQGGYEALSGRSIGGGSLSTGERVFSGVGAVVPFVSGSQLRLATNAATHIFRSKLGHVNPATLTSQMRYTRLFQSVASNPANLRPDLLNPLAARAGVEFYAQIFHRGQVWVQVRNGEIFDAGLNRPGFFR